MRELKERLEHRTPCLMDAKRQCSVLVPLVERDGEFFVLYEVRALHMKHQPGEVCFPGGRNENGEGPEECAVRETWEELGIGQEQIQILGRLDFIAHRAGFLMQPVLAVVDGAALEHMRRNPDEVEETFLVPLSYLMETEPLEYEYPLLPQPGETFPYELVGVPRDYRWVPGRETVPVYPWKDHAIWGLTGRITRNLVQFLNEIGLQ